MFDFSKITDNPFFSGGFVLLVIGGLLAYLRNVPGKMWNFFERFFIVKIDIQDEDESYQWMRVWLAERLSKTLSISVVTHRKKSYTSNEDYEGTTVVTDNRPTVHFVPAVGTYFFWYKRRFVILSRDRNEQSNPMVGGGQTAGNSLRPKESFTIRIFSRKKQLAYNLIEDCKQAAIPPDGKIDIRITAYNYWELGGRVLPRPMESVILDGNQGEYLLSDIKEFLNSAKWYADLGIPYRRGYLLHGEPGNGKSSLVLAIASALNMNVYVLNLSNPNLNDSQLNHLLFAVADNSLVLIEDVDCVFTKRKKNEGERAGLLTFSGLLNAIDGIASHSRILFMTTNHPEKLDAALIRPGRADIKLYIGNATKDQAYRLFIRFYPKDQKLGEKFAELIPDKKVSMATLQGHLMKHKISAYEALHHIADILPEEEETVRLVGIAQNQ